MASSAEESSTAASNPREVAVVHGRDQEVNSAIFEFLRALDLRPREWEELLKRTSGATPYTGQLVDKLFEDAQAVIVVFTPDDETRLHPDLHVDESEHETRFEGQPRPNVLFEAGMSFGKYPDRTILVEAGDIRPISDLIGRHTVRLGDSNAITSFVNRLESAGCPTNTDGSDWNDQSRFRNLSALNRSPEARIEVTEKPPRLFPTNFWLNPWEVGSREEIMEIADQQDQEHPVMHRKLERDLSRSTDEWSLYSRKDGPTAPLRLKGQANLQCSGPFDLQLKLVQHRFAVEGRPLPHSPDAGPMGFELAPGQEFNATFEVQVPDQDYGEGELLYGLRVIYEDEKGETRDLEVFSWYHFEEDKFFQNMNKVPYFESIKENIF